MKKRKYIYGTALFLVLGIYGLNMFQVHGLEKELHVIADEKLAEYAALDSEHPDSQLQVGVAVVATRAYVLFGDTFGKVSMYFRNSSSDDTTITGLEFFYAKDESGEWSETESGTCSSEQCTKEGLRILGALNAK